MKINRLDAMIGGHRMKVCGFTRQLPGLALSSLEQLITGHSRWRGGCTNPKRFSIARQQKLVEGQEPYCAIVYCSDSRVPVEVIFDADAGDIFGIRNAGNTARAPQKLGSIEYAVRHLDVPLVIVLGHTHCGAVTAACSGSVEGNIAEIARDLEPAVHAAREHHPDRESTLVELAVAENVKHTMKVIYNGSAVVREAVDRGKLLLTGAVFDIATGDVSFELP